MWKITNSILTIMIFFVVVLVSCSDSNNSQQKQTYTDFIPNFSVNLPENVVSDSEVTLIMEIQTFLSPQVLPVYKD